MGTKNNPKFRHPLCYFRWQKKPQKVLYFLLQLTSRWSIYCHVVQDYAFCLHNEEMFASSLAPSLLFHSYPSLTSLGDHICPYRWSYKKSRERTVIPKKKRDQLQLISTRDTKDKNGNLSYFQWSLSVDTIPKKWCPSLTTMASHTPLIEFFRLCVLNQSNGAGASSPRLLPPPFTVDLQGC